VALRQALDEIEVANSGALTRRVRQLWRQEKDVHVRRRPAS